jgi:Spy/CpxP family protein refolding chaperone
MKRRTLIITIVAALALAAVPLVYAQGHHGRGGDDFGGGMLFGRLARAQSALGLSDAQVEQLKAIGTDLRAQNKPLREQLHGGFAGVAQALINNPNDLAAAQTLLDQQEQVERTMKSNALAAASKALNILTPDQRAKVGQFIAAHHGHNDTH